MGMLNYKTRGNFSPQGKPRVYFCAHPADFNIYFESISNDILSKQNVSIWYIDVNNPSKIDNEHFDNLSQMQLFVMPVTTNLLTKDNYALDVEFKYAIDHHIPVLPIMQEHDLEELFNKKCGDLQFLDKTVRDITAISYDVKLTKYLESVIIGDELAEKIRAAFDAYIFLSYRKKDRKYAQELMHLIHKNEFCRDIAIWYDEFLIPGENFNESIAEELQKSKLFALVVTPNLVNEENYVMTVEYPEAKKVQKYILPLEMIPTEREVLERQYEDIPSCINAHDGESLSTALIDALNNIAIRKNDSNPRHDFLIGLAYLSGIDVEINYVRALELITNSAKTGMPEAIKKLIAMYHNGEGVERDYLTEIHWREKLLEWHRARYMQTKIKKFSRAYLWELLELGDAWKSLQESGRDRAKSIFLQAIYLSDRLVFSNSYEKKDYCNCCYDRLCDIAIIEKDVSLAKQYAEKSLTYAKWKHNQFQSETSKQSLWVCYSRLGHVAEMDEKPELAQKYYMKCLEYCKKTPGTLEEVFEVGSIYRDIFLVATKIGNKEIAEEYGNKVVRTIEQVLGFNKYQDGIINTEHYAQINIINGRLDSVAHLYATHAASLAHKRDDENAEKYYRKAIAFGEKAIESKLSIAGCRNLCEIYGDYACFIKPHYSSNPIVLNFCVVGFKLSKKILNRISKMFGEITPEAENVLCNLSFLRKYTFLEKTARKYNLLDSTGNIVWNYNQYIRNNARQKEYRYYNRKAITLSRYVINKTKDDDDYHKLAQLYRKFALKEHGWLRKRILKKAYRIWKCLYKKDKQKYSKCLDIIMKDLNKL